MSNLYFIITKKNVINYDSSEPWGIYFQDNATPQMEGLEELHNNIMFYLAIILFAVSWKIISIIINFKNKKISNKYVNHDTLVQLILTSFPVLILIFIAIPSLKLLYLMDEVIDPGLGIYGEGHQWYWNYQYADYINTEEETVGYVTEFLPNNIYMNAVTDWSRFYGEYVDALRPHKGQTLRSLSLSAGPFGPNLKFCRLTGWLLFYDPGAFCPYDIDGTVISDYYLYRASLMPSTIAKLIENQK